MKRRKWLAIALFLVLFASGAAIWFFFSKPTPSAWKFAKIERGPLTAAVAATGTLTPVASVQVSSQISGQIREIFVDFNSPVKKGDLLARIAPETYEHRLRQAEADLEAARALVAVQQAELYRAKVNLADAERDFARKKTLVEKNYLSPAELDKAATALAAARAQLAVVEAQSRNSAALVRQREAQVGQARVDLSRTEIRSPVDGVVVKKSVEPGQTVAASLQAPELFVIAKSLADMQLEAAIDEADIGRIRVGQTAHFTVDAFPGQRFSGKVVQVRKAAQVVSNVVSYTVVISAANPDLILLPGMTANVKIVTEHKDDVLKVANAALRFTPPSREKEAKEAGAGDPARKGASKDGTLSAGSRLWRLGKDGKPEAVEVKTGISDGRFTELVASGGLAPGDEVIIGMTKAAPDKPRGSATPPRMF